MKTILKIAWRNVWRNKRRTIITLSSIFFAVLLAIFQRSMSMGGYQSMIENVVGLYSGYIQIHDADYWEDKSINKLLQIEDKLYESAEKHGDVVLTLPRLESFALSASEELTKGVFVMGIDPEKEAQMTGVDKKVQEGEYLQLEDNGILISSGLGKFLHLGIGDTLVLIGQGYHGISAAGKYPIKGVVKITNPKMDNGTVYMPLPLAQEFLGAPNMASAIVIMLSSFENTNAIKTDIAEVLGEEYEVMTWEEMQPELVQIIESDNAGGIIMLGILYMVIAFGMLGTIIMMTAERRKEFGIMIAIGMHKWRLEAIMFFESLILGTLGVLFSYIAGSTLLSFMQDNPIQLTGNAAESMLKLGVEPVIPFANDIEIYLTQGLIIFIVLVFAQFYPLFDISRLKVMDALRS